MTCVHCGGVNQPSASSCEHCGRPLGNRPAVDAGYVDAEFDSESGFAAAMHAATPKLLLSTVLVVANVAVYVVMVLRGVHAFNPTTDELLRWGANYGPATQAGQWWRLLTSAFVHIGLVHLAMNMIVLWTGGHIIERLFGQISFAALYAISAIGGSLTSLAVHPMTTSAGASGAIFGIYGGLIAYLLVCRAALPHGIRSTMIQSAVTFVAYNLLYGLAFPHVDVAAHVGGLLSGFVAGAAIATPMDSQPAVRARRALLATAVLVLAMIGVASRLQRFDDWTSAVNAWLKDEASLDRRIAEDAEKVGARKMPPQQFADRIEHEFIPELTQQRARIAALRLPRVEASTAHGVVAFLGLKIDALKLAAEAQRSGDPEAQERAAKKNEEALETLLRVAPSPAMATRIQQLAQHRELQRNFVEQVKRLQDFDRATNITYNNAARKVRLNQLRPAEFATLIETDVLKPWNEERQRLATLEIPTEQTATRQRFLDYMDKRAEAWQLVAKGVRSNDPKQIRAAAEKTAEAMKLLQQR